MVPLMNGTCFTEVMLMFGKSCPVFRRMEPWCQENKTGKEMAVPANVDGSNKIQCAEIITIYDHVTSEDLKRSYRCP